MCNTGGDLTGEHGRNWTKAQNSDLRLMTRNSNQQPSNWHPVKTGWGAQMHWWLRRKVHRFRVSQGFFGLKNLTLVVILFQIY